MSPQIISMNEFGFDLAGFFRSFAAVVEPMAIAETVAEGSEEIEFAGHVADEALNKAFLTTLLLTASAERAEAALLEAIEDLDLFAASDDELLQAVVKAALPGYGFRRQRAVELERAARLLPVELRGVLRLPEELRHCYVLRVLAGLPGEFCARVLNLSVDEFEEATCVAVRTLARAD